MTLTSGPDCATDPSGLRGFGNQPAALFPRAFLIILATAFAVVFPFFLLGVLAGHDFDFHLNSWMEVAAQWKQGIAYPRWAQMANYGYGEPRFIFYPPISWILGAALGTVLPWKLVPGTFIWIALTLSGCSMFVLARTWVCRRDAIFAAALYATNPYFLIIIYWRSDFAELLAGAILPVLVLYCLRAQAGGRKELVSLSLIVAAAWLTNAPVAVMANYSLVLLIAIIFIRHRSWRAGGIGLASLIFGMGIAAIYVLPAAYEQQWIAIGEVLVSGFRPQDNFLFTHTGDVGHDAFNQLLTIIAVGQIVTLTLAMPIALRRQTIQRNSIFALLSWAAISAFLLFPASRPVWNLLPKLQFLQFPWRWLLCGNVAFVLFVTIAWQKRPLRVGLYLGIIGMLIFGAWRIQRPWKKTSEDIRRMATMHAGEGYKSRPEYIPVGADPKQADPNAKRATLESNMAAQIKVSVWHAESKVIIINSATPNRLLLRLFMYPAWHAEVNGVPAIIKPVIPGGQISVPVPMGESRVEVKFERTSDRLLGGTISAITLILLFLFAFKFPLNRSA